MKNPFSNLISASSPHLAGLLVAAFTLAVPAARAANLVVNGDFEQLRVPGSSMEFGSRYPYQQVTGWTTNGYNFVFTPGSADTSGAIGEYGGLFLWGPNNGSNNGLTATSPAGGNYLAFDGAYAVGPISQTISGLTPGKAVTLSFYWGGAQQLGYNGSNTEQIQVSLGNETRSTAVFQNVEHGFSGWRQEVFSFAPTSTTEVLSFLAIGTPNGVPPFSLLDGVVLSDSPEPATGALLALCLALVAGYLCFRRPRRRSVATSFDSQ